MYRREGIPCERVARRDLERAFEHGRGFVVRFGEVQGHRKNVQPGRIGRLLIGAAE